LKILHDLTLFPVSAEKDSESRPDFRLECAKDGVTPITAKHVAKEENNAGLKGAEGNTRRLVMGRSAPMHFLLGMCGGGAR
jgi:hypothetical protein